MADFGGIVAATAGEARIGGHFTGGRELHGARHVDALRDEDAMKGVKSGGQRDFRMSIANGDGGPIFLRARQEGAVDALGKIADGGAVGRPEWQYLDAKEAALQQ